MPRCKLCRRRIDVSKTGVVAYKCRNCGSVVCKGHFVPEKELCLKCAGVDEEEIERRGRPFGSFVRKKAHK